MFSVAEPIKTVSKQKHQFDFYNYYNNNYFVTIESKGVRVLLLCL